MEGIFLKNKITFQKIETHSHKVEENELFIQYSNLELSDRYDSNYLQLKFSPTLEEFKWIEDIQLSYQKSIQQHHLKFVWPDNVGLHTEVLNYFDANNYKIGMQNLYWTTKEFFSLHEINEALSIQEVDDTILEDFMRINLEEDLNQGKSYYDHKKKVYDYQYQLENIKFLIAYLKNIPVGSLILIQSDNFLEVDNVLTVSNYRGKRVASTLLNEVVHAIAKENQTVILVADAEDTPKEMYEKMNFQYAGFQISAQKDLYFK